MRARTLPAVLAVVLVASAATVGAATHPFSIHDMLAMQRISDPQLSPEGESVVFVLRTTDLEANRGRTDLWQIGIDGSGLRQLTETAGPRSRRDMWRAAPPMAILSKLSGLFPFLSREHRGAAAMAVLTVAMGVVVVVLIVLL